MFPNPGLGYTIKERLGAGNWKEAFRATNPSHGKDVAIVFFRDKNEREEALKEGSKLLRLSLKEHKHSGYIAEFYGANYSPDRHMFFVEELIEIPLDRVGTVKTLSKLANFARDLCRGLDYLHSNGLVHRDLKLDNCGQAFNGRIKIFDLGSVTSEHGEVKGTILTRAPELFASSAKRKRGRGRKAEPDATASADVWALGATIYALRTGTYPFVLQNEIEERRRINEKLKSSLANAADEKTRDMARREAEENKAKIDQSVTDRITSIYAESQLAARIEEHFKGPSAEIVKSMLIFDPQKRKTAGEYAEEWDAIFAAADQLNVKEIGQISTTKYKDITSFAHRIANHEVTITHKQRQRLVEEILHDLQLGATDQATADKIIGLIPI